MACYLGNPHWRPGDWRRQTYNNKDQFSYYEAHEAARIDYENTSATSTFDETDIPDYPRNTIWYRANCDLAGGLGDFPGRDRCA
jgi:hypothetical protein